MRPLILTLILLIGGCASAPPSTPPAPDRTLLLPGVRLEAPAEDGWATVERSAERIVLSRSTPEVTATLTATVLPADASGDGKAFIRAAEAEREAEMGALEMVSVHYNGSSLSGATCLAHDGIYRDPLADPARQFRTVMGYVCQHPVESTRVVRMELSFDSSSRTPPETEALFRVADGFFRSVVFSR